MATSYTTLLGLALPVTGELSGTWGDTVNNYLTNYLDSAVAGALTVTGDTTLTKTTGSSLVSTSSQYAIIIASPASANITITAPAASKIYTIINTSGTYTVKIVGAGPTTGVTLGVSEKAQVAWNGSDFVRVGASGGAGVFSSITNTGLTSGRVVYSTTGGLETDSANLTFNGTTLTANTLNLTSALGTSYGGTGLTSFTSGGVVYASSGSALTTGSALSWDGTNFYARGSSASVITTGKSSNMGSASNIGYFNVQAPNASGTATTWFQIRAFTGNATAGSESSLAYFSTITAGTLTDRMVLNASGNLALSTSNRSWGSNYRALDVSNVGSVAVISTSTPITTLTTNCYNDNTNWIYTSTQAALKYTQNTTYHSWEYAASGTAGNTITFTEGMRLDASGNLLVGTTTAVSGSKAVVDSGDLTVYGITVGRGAGAVSTNTVFGASAFATNTAGTDNTAIGYYAARYSTGSYNTAIGDSAYSGASASGSYNTCVGNQAGLALTTGSQNTIIGKFGGSIGIFDISTKSNYIVLSDGASSIGAVYNPSRVGFYYQADETTKSTTATLTGAEVLTQILNTTGTSYTVTMPLATDLLTAIGSIPANMSFRFSVINTASGTITMAVNTGITSLGSLSVPTGTSATFIIKRSGSSAFVMYRT